MSGYTRVPSETPGPNGTPAPRRQGISGSARSGPSPFTPNLGRVDESRFFIGAGGNYVPRRVSNWRAPTVERDPSEPYEPPEAFRGLSISPEVHQDQDRAASYASRSGSYEITGSQPVTGSGRSGSYEITGSQPVTGSGRSGSYEVTGSRPVAGAARSGRFEAARAGPSQRVRSESVEFVSAGPTPPSRRRRRREPNVQVQDESEDDGLPIVIPRWLLVAHERLLDLNGDIVKLEILARLVRNPRMPDGFDLVYTYQHMPHSIDLATVRAPPIAKNEAPNTISAGAYWKAAFTNVGNESVSARQRFVMPQRSRRLAIAAMWRQIHGDAHDAR